MEAIRAWSAAKLTFVSVALATSCIAEPDTLETVEKASEAWLQTRLEAARVETSWKNERALLESTIAALQERAATEEEKRDLANARTAKEREELDSLRAKTQAARDDISRLDTTLKALGDRLVELRSNLPPRLSGGLEMAFRSLAQPDLSPGERMQFTMTIINRTLQFNRAITGGEEVIVTQPGEPARALEVIYWGLSQGYALDRSAGKAWHGRPGPRGWEWLPRPEAVGAVARLLSIYNGRSDPEFVVIPATIAAQAARHNP